MAAPSASWYPPLPPGWEARWDNNQRAYFYIDHTNKVTSWEDPRTKFMQQATPQFTPQSHVATADKQHTSAAQLLNQNTGTTASGHGNIPLDTRYVQHGSTITSGLYMSSGTDSSESDSDLGPVFSHKHPHPSANSTAEVKVTVDKLQKIFPQVKYDVIWDVVLNAQNHEAKAKISLESMGYKAVTPSSHSPAKAKTKHPSPSKTNQHVTAPPKVSEAEKRRLKEKLRRDHNNIDASVVEMALESVNYDETKAHKILKGWTKTKQPSRPKTADSGFSDSHSSRPTTATGTEPVALDMNVGLPLALDSERPSSSSRNAHRSPAKGKDNKSRTPSPKKEVRGQKTSGQNSRGQNTRAKNVTRMSENLLSSTNNVMKHLAKACCLISPGPSGGQQGDNRTPAAGRGVVTTQPRITSEYRTLAKGPDPSLRQGPNKDHLLSELIQAHGPDPALRCGPDHSRVLGSQGAVGPDPSLRCGPMSISHGGNLLVSMI